MVNGRAPDPTVRIERAVRLVLGVAVLGAIMGAVVSMLHGLARPAGRVLGRPALVSRPGLLGATAAFLAVGRALWRPLPGAGAAGARRIGLIVGSPLLASGLGLYQVARRQLGPMHQASSGLGVRLYADQRLVTTGVYGIVRHPMYLAVVAATIGALLLYRTWATLAGLVLVVSVVLRARREDAALDEVFGEEWRRYRARVPGWLPRLGQRG